MRIIITVILALLTVAALADGMSYGRLFPVIQETDQTALVHVGRERVDVDMYIAIDGIPPGESLTYILPFWQKPEHFALEEVDAQQFYAAHTKTFWEQAKRERSLAHISLPQIMGAITVLGTALTCGPLGGFSLPACFLLIPRVMGGGHRPLQPFTTVTTPAATAKLFKVETGRDLQEVLAQAKLPAAYAQKLARYHTKYYAIMQLRGLQQQKTSAPRGVHYSFYHAASGADYTYTYPLGTGIGWAKPILLTEVYIACDPDRYLSVTAPTVGKNTPYFDFNINFRRGSAGESASADDPDTQAPQTSTLLPTPLRQPAIWHRAYLNSNPGDDITVRTRPRFFLDGLLRLFYAPDLPYLPVALWLAVLIASYAIAIKRFLLPAAVLCDDYRTNVALISTFLGKTLLANLLGGALTVIIIIFGAQLWGLLGWAGLGLAVLLAACACYLGWRGLMRSGDGALPPGTMARTGFAGMVLYLIGSGLLIGLSFAVQAMMIA